MRKKSYILICLVVLLVVATAIGLVTGVGSGEPSLALGGAEMSLSPVLLNVATATMDIVNSGDGDDRLVGVRVDGPRVIAELHDVKDFRMVKVDGIPVPRRGTTTLRHGGPHIMLLGLPKGLGEGAQMTLSLSFARSGERQIMAKLIN
jgi:hypothetical protein